MGSSGKRKTTMAKLNRERKLQERRRDKAARKDARRNAPPEWETAVGTDQAPWDGDVTADPSDSDAELIDPAAPDGAAAPDGIAAHETA